MTEDEIRKANPDRPRLYRAATDEFDFATQEDIDRMQEVVSAYGRIFGIVNELSAKRAREKAERDAEFWGEHVTRPKRGESAFS